MIGGFLAEFLKKFLGQLLFRAGGEPRPPCFVDRWPVAEYWGFVDEGDLWRREGDRGGGIM